MAGRMMMNHAAHKGKQEQNEIIPIEPIEEPSLEHYNDHTRYTNPVVREYVRISKQFWEVSYGKYSGGFDAFIITVIMIAGAMVGIQTYPDYECPAPSMQDKDYRDNTKDKNQGFCERHASEWFGGDGYIDTFVFWTFVSEVVIKIVANGAAPHNYFIGPERKWNLFDFTIVMLSVPEVAAFIFGGSGGGGNLMILRLFRLARLLKLVGKIKKLQSIVMGLAAGIKAAGYIAILLFLVFYIFAIAGILAFGRNDPFHFRSIPIALLSLFRAATMEDWTDIMYISMYGCDVYKTGIYYTDEMKIAGSLDSNPYFKTWEELPNYFKCTHPSSQPALAAFYWVLFIFCSSFVMLSLFIGAITIAMSEQMQQQEGQAEQDLEERRHLSHLIPRAKRLHKNMIHVWNKYAAATNNPEVSHGKDRAVYKLGVYSRFAELNSLLHKNEWFENFVTLTILVAGVMEGIDTELNGAANPDSGRRLNVLLWYADVVITWIFTVEVLVKVVAEDWHPWRYFNDGWNRFDFVIVFTSWVPLLLEAAGVGGGSGLGALKLLRLLRLFRIMRVIKKLPELTVIVDALLVGMESIGFIALILFVVFYLFAVGGMMLFQSNDPWHFGRLHRALLTLFRIATFEDWTDVMYINVYGCSRWGYNDDDTQPKSGACVKVDYEPKAYAAFYFIVFIFLGSLVLLTLFVGVVTTSMEEAQSTQRNVMDGERLVIEFFARYEMDLEVADQLMVVFNLIDQDGDGEVTLNEFLSCCKVLTALKEEVHPPKLLEETVFCMDQSGNPPPERGNPFVFMKFLMNYMAACAESNDVFLYEEVKEIEVKVVDPQKRSSVNLLKKKLSQEFSKAFNANGSPNSSMTDTMPKSSPNTSATL
eukprot:CAMPEP_0114330520 /NCGR_PEP_ID=MMETSP0101-20121206/1809_1 /TAXON_ID=38822 ORGANISM="Pteridomonas danica, Strain PT" /NCGR_SAMPLE_ID=MMETSP0101 /ASSEMBLY_ACC=CAM_ASM_000211 /LENGTH=870 /DNA_ID=CAMNT_0001460565 /DNA_START=45 /DNA_END=2657 /DNA_ORIENTATION=-